DPPDEPTGLGVGLIGHRTRIDHDHVGSGPVVRRASAAGLDLLPHPLGVVLIRLAAERLIEDAHCGSAPDGHRPETRSATVPRQNCSTMDPAFRSPRSTARSTPASTMPFASLNRKPSPPVNALSVALSSPRAKGSPLRRYPSRSGARRASRRTWDSSTPTPKPVVPCAVTPPLRSSCSVDQSACTALATSTRPGASTALP